MIKRDCGTLCIRYNEDIKFHADHKHSYETTGWGVNYVHQNMVRIVLILRITHTQQRRSQ